MSLISQVLPEDIKQEFSIDENGKASATGRATARLAGVSQEAVRKILLKLSDNLKVSKSLKSFVGQNFKGDNLPDIFYLTYKINGKRSSRLLQTDSKKS